MLDSVIKTGHKYYPQTFLEECIYKQQKRKNYITEELKPDSHSNDDDQTKSDVDNNE